MTASSRPPAICRTSSTASSAARVVRVTTTATAPSAAASAAPSAPASSSTPRGYIITNNHVVDKADKIYVKLSTDPDGGPGDNGRPATVIGVDKDTDIAVIKIDAKEPLPTVKLGNSDGAQVGDWVLAIGSPFALSKTVTAGIISAKNRTIDEPTPSGISQSQFQHFIQTDAAINPGNSGGPLVDMAGQVVGMNTAIYTQSMGSQGVGFAMPANTIASVYNMLIGPEHKVVRGSIGISYQPSLNSAVNRMYGFQNGVIVSTVTPNGGAAKAGLRPGDVIVSIDGRNIKDGDDLVADISARRVGSSVKLGYLRDGKQSAASVAIGDRAKTYADITGATDDDNAAPQQSDIGKSKLGITVSAIPPAVTAKTGNRNGVIVTSVRPGSFADDIRSRQGRHHHRNQQEACHRRSQLQGHRLNPQVQGRRRLCRPVSRPEEPQLLRRRHAPIAHAGKHVLYTPHGGDASSVSLVFCSCRCRCLFLVPKPTTTARVPHLRRSRIAPKVGMYPLPRQPVPLHLSLPSSSPPIKTVISTEAVRAFANSAAEKPAVLLHRIPEHTVTHVFSTHPAHIPQKTYAGLTLRLPHRFHPGYPNKMQSSGSNLLPFH